MVYALQQARAGEGAQVRLFRFTCDACGTTCLASADQGAPDLWAVAAVRPMNGLGSFEHFDLCAVCRYEVNDAIKTRVQELGA